MSLWAKQLDRFHSFHSNSQEKNVNMSEVRHRASSVENTIKNLQIYTVEDILTKINEWGSSCKSEFINKKLNKEIKRIKQSLEQAVTQLRNSYCFQFKNSDGQEMLINTKKKTIWYLECNSQLAINQTQDWNLSNFNLPDVNQLTAFLKLKGNPYATAEKRLLNNYKWLTEHGGVDLDSMSPGEHRSGYLILKSEMDIEASLGVDLFELLVVNALLGHITIGDVFTAKGSENLNLSIELKNTLSVESFKTIDSFSVPLPELSDSDLKDPQKGLWELWGEDQTTLKELNVRARNPVDDIKHSPVAIDFGTSSTVVAIQEQGKKSLLRVGVKDFYQKPEAKHFENPTVLNFRDFKFLAEAWQSEAYRPAVAWSDVKCSHEALATLRDNEGDTNVTAAILTKIKHWALREAQAKPTKITAQNTQQELELPNLTMRKPIKGQRLSVSNEDPFDPVELYAWYLGMMINWRGRGLFLKYFMSFPVAYPQETKDKILSSFQRGIQRSFPETLIAQPEFDQFSITETASEPTALAAATLPVLGIEPSEEGEAYAVFDFGGGTTDFDYGIYRYATEDEEDNDGIEEVFEHFGASGDKFLGGENLLENLAYLVLKENYDLCRQEALVFTKPMDADSFPGSELLVQSTLSAQTNTQMVMAKLRSYWEEGEEASAGTMSFNLLTREGKEVRVDLAIDYDLLNAFLASRITQGVKNFFIAMQKGFAEQEFLPEKVHLVLAGNASHSRYIKELFNLADDQPSLEQGLEDFVTKLFNSKVPQFEIYAPINKDDNNLYKPNAKTAVALGLLDFRAGSPIRVINRNHLATGGEAIFNFYVGRIRRRNFKPAIKRGATFGKWHELGVIRDRVFDLVFSHSPQANTGEMPQDHSELTYQHLSFAGNCDGQKLFAKIIGPNVIQYCTAQSIEQIGADNYENIENLELK